MNLWLIVILTLFAPADPHLSPHTEPTSVKAPIQDVIVYSDRAGIIRRGSASVDQKGAVIRFPDLPSNTIKGSVRISSKAGRVVHVEVRSRRRVAISLEPLEGLIKEMEQLLTKRYELTSKRLIPKPVSYTHLTLPTIYSV